MYSAPCLGMIDCTDNPLAFGVSGREHTRQIVEQFKERDVNLVLLESQHPMHKPPSQLGQEVLVVPDAYVARSFVNGPDITGLDQCRRQARERAGRRVSSALSRQNSRMEPTSSNAPRTSITGLLEIAAGFAPGSSIEALGVRAKSRRGLRPVASESKPLREHRSRYHEVGAPTWMRAEASGHPAPALCHAGPRTGPREETAPHPTRLVDRMEQELDGVLTSLAESRWMQEAEEATHIAAVRSRSRRKQANSFVGMHN